MKRVNIKNQKGITLVALIITIAIMLIVSVTTIFVSLDRFEVNNLKRMYNDIGLLGDKSNNYYLKYGSLPVLEEYDLTLNFDTSNSDNDKYYIIDIEVMDGMLLNYGKEGYEDAKNDEASISDDVYIINEATHNIYYVKGIKMDEDVYHYLYTGISYSITDTIPPTKPKINVASGERNQDDTYSTQVQLEFVPGKDSLSGINRTTYEINNSGIETDISTLTNNMYTVTETTTIKLKTYDNNENNSEETMTITISNGS